MQNYQDIKTSKILYSDVITIDNLRDGYNRTKGGKSPGIDGITKAIMTADQITKLHK